MSGDRWWYVVYTQTHSGIPSTIGRVIQYAHPLVWWGAMLGRECKATWPGTLLWWQELPNEIDPETLEERIV